MAFWRHKIAGRLGTLDQRHAELPVMGFGDHLDELRKRVIFALLGTAVAVAICLYFDQQIIGFLYGPYLMALRYSGYSVQIFYRKPAGGLISYLMTGVKAGVVLAAPWIIYQAWAFVAVGLYPRERKAFYRYLAPTIGFFVAGVLFFFILVLPIMLKFFMQFNNAVKLPPPQPTMLEQWIFGKAASTANVRRFPAGNKIHPLVIPIVRSDPTKFPPHQAVLWYNASDMELKMHVGSMTLQISKQPAGVLFSPLPMLGDYLSFVTIMCLIFGISFEVPMVMLVLSKIGVVSAAKFRRMWRVAVLVLAVASVVLAPTPDVVTFSTIFVPLVALYMLGLVLAALGSRPKPAPAPEPPASDQS